MKGYVYRFGRAKKINMVDLKNGAPKVQITNFSALFLISLCANLCSFFKCSL